MTASTRLLAVLDVHAWIDTCTPPNNIENNNNNSNNIITIITTAITTIITTITTVITAINYNIFI